jgi:hypothetical protein
VRRVTEKCQFAELLVVDQTDEERREGICKPVAYDARSVVVGAAGQSSRSRKEGRWKR